MVVTVVLELHQILLALEFHMLEEEEVVEHLEVVVLPWVLVVLVVAEMLRLVLQLLELQAPQTLEAEAEAEMLLQAVQAVVEL
jgi:hypothetical protein